jgi:hypothetical protein
MRKKYLALLLAAAIFLLSGCVSGKDYRRLSDAQKSVGALKSGRITVTSSYNPAEGGSASVTEFLFRMTESGCYEYCQTQYDQNQKAVYCEYSDGAKSEQWLLGRGWSVLDSTVYTAEEPHRYLKLIATPFEKKAIDDLLVSEEDGNLRYYLTLDPSVLNRTLYRDSGVEILEEKLEVLAGSDGQLLFYCDDSRLLDKTLGEESAYRLEMQLSDLNAVTEVPRPSLK